MKRLLTALLLPALAAVLPAGCDKKTPPPAPQQTPTGGSQTQTPSISAPAEVPQQLKDRVAREWPEIERMGEEFMELFGQAGKARDAGDREAMSDLIDRANELYRTLTDRWNVIYYSVDDYEEKVAEKCRRWLDTYESQFNKWQKANKSLKEFSQAR